MRIVLAIMFLSLAAAVSAAGSAVDAIEAHRHMGVASCANSVCHGAAQPFTDSNVLQNEFAIWQEFDPHSGAYRTLLSDESKAIARKLGLPDAHTADICLDCHADNVAVDKRGDRFRLEDGVGCEACHGGAELWLSSHTVPGTAHADNIANGLYPTSDPVKRAELCLSCHMGSPDRMITHRIMGAGHPRLSYELDTFTWLNPHYEIDDDYVERKQPWNGLRDWGVGQGVAADNLLAVLSDNQAGWNGIFPELVLFDCHACHRAMSNSRWGPRQGTGLGPGVVRLNDSNLVMFRHVLAAVDGNLATQLREQSRQLHRATTQSRDETLAQARQLRQTLSNATARVSAHDFTATSLKTILSSLVADADAGEMRDFAAGEQAAMAAQSVVVAFETEGLLDEAQTTRLRNAVDTLYVSVEDEDNYNMSRLVSGLRGVRDAAP